MFVTTKTDTNPVLGIKTIEELNLLKTVNKIEIKNAIGSVEENSDQEYIKDLLDSNRKLFEGIGKLDFMYNFKLKPDYTGKIEPCRKVPFGILKDFKEELDNLEKKLIISKIDEPTEFVNTFTLLKKKN